MIIVPIFLMQLIHVRVYGAHASILINLARVDDGLQAKRNIGLQ